MEIKSIIIDTNAYAEFKKGNPKAVEIVRKANNIIFNPIVIGELIAGFILGSKEKENRKELEQLLDSKKIICVNIDDNTSEQFAQIFKELKQKGKPIPTNDMWIAATAKQYNLGVFSNDKHFKYIDNLKVIFKPQDLMT